MSDYDYSDYEEEDANFGDEFAARDRVSTGLLGDTGEFSFDPKDKFTRRVYNITTTMIKKGRISTGDRDIIIEGISSLKNAGMRSASAFVLGYVASGGGRQVTREGWKRAYKYFQTDVKEDGQSSVWDSNLTQVDVIRYGRYWSGVSQR